MGLASRDLWIILRARDVASATIRGVGMEVFTLGKQTSNLTKQQLAARKAMMASGAAIQQLGKFATTAGIGLTALGLAGAGAIKSFTSAAQEFERSAALAVTQVHNGKTSAQELEKISMNVARVIPVPIESLNQALFDIFSSTDIKVKDSAKVLRQFSIAAVAGQDDIKSVGRTAITILNAWDLSLGSLNHVFDVQFKMVQLGVGTYKEFAAVLGRAVPSVRAAGQSFEFLAGTMAFLTRRGQSTAQAAVSIARLTDMFRRPEATQGLADIGKVAIKVTNAFGMKLAPAARKALEGIHINALNAQGKLRPINELLTEMAPVFARLNVPMRAGLFKAIFGGQGTIQARRFFDLAIDHTKQLNRFIRDVGFASGSTKKAYDEMAATFAAKSQLLKNNWEILKIQLGNALIPQVAKLIEQVIKLLTWLENLSPHTKELIAKFLLWGTIIAIVAGVFLTLLGVIGMLVGGMFMLAGALGLTFGAFAALAAVFAIGIVITIALWIVILKYHKQIWAFLVRIWNDIAGFFIRIWNDIFGWVRRVLPEIAAFFVDRWRYIQSQSASIWNAIVGFLSDLWKSVKGIASEAWNAVVNFLKDRWEFAKNTTISIWNAIFGFLKAAWKIIRIAFAVWLSLILLPWIVLWNLFGKQLKATWHGFLAFLKLIWRIIADFFKDQWAIAVVLWKNLWESFKIIGVAFWHAINIAFRFVWLQIKKFFLDQWAIFVVFWRGLWIAIKLVGFLAWQAINTGFRFAWLQIKKFFVDQWNVAVTLWKNLWESFKILGKSGWSTITGIIKGAWRLIMDFFRNQITPFKTIWKNFVESLRIIWNSIKGIFSSPVNWVIAHVLNPFIRTLNRISKKFGVALNISEIPPLGGGGTQTGKQGSGRRVAAGGMVRGPGGPRADLINAWLSNGEFIVNAASTARHRQLLEAINSNRFAGGGIVGAVTDPVGTAVNFALRKLPGGAGVQKLISGMAHALISALAGAVKTKISTFFGPSGGGAVIAGGTHAPSGVIQAVAMAMLKARGWGSMWSSFNALEMGEAGWNPFAQNPTSTAYGLGQFLDSTWATVGGHKTSDYRLQLEYMMRYIAQVYGNPARAYGAWLSRSPHWYDQGGYLPPGLSLAYNGTGRPERVSPTSGATTQNFYITTQEIDPRRHAQQLGWELSMRG